MPGMVGGLSGAAPVRFWPVKREVVMETRLGASLLCSSGVV